MNRKVPFFQIATDGIVARLLSEYLVKPSGKEFWKEVVDTYATQMQTIIKEHEVEVLPSFAPTEQTEYREAMSQVQAQGLNKLRAEILYIRGGQLDFKTS